MIRIASAAAILLVTGAALAQPEAGPPKWGVMEQSTRLANVSRLHHALMRGIPQPYAALRDPSPDTASKLRRGAVVYQQNCASCHGQYGSGTGAEGEMLVPSPADLSWLAGTPPNRSGPYMYWSIAEGGRAFGSEMPAFKGALPRRDIWAVIAYIRRGVE